jgi:hypothetical protein
MLLNSIPDALLPCTCPLPSSPLPALLEPLPVSALLAAPHCSETVPHLPILCNKDPTMFEDHFRLLLPSLCMGYPLNTVKF